nr:pectate lyase [uncultured bacterium]
MRKSNWAVTTAILLALSAAPLAAKPIGQITLAVPLSPARLTETPPEQRAQWQAYLATTEAQLKADKAALAAERAGLAEIPAKPKTGSANTMPLDKPLEWYASSEARLVADNIVSYQTPAGGWGKNQARNEPTRLKGQAYTIDDADPTGSGKWNFVGTIDNDATIVEIRFLARVAAAATGPEGDVYRASATRGITYLLAAQYPNGGWPQVWPLQGGYHDAITLNDGAMIHVLELFDDIASGQGDFAFLPEPLRDKVEAAQAKGQKVLLDLQLKRNGERTLWAQQYDPITLLPSAARNYEPSSISTGESAGVLIYLMSLPNPSPEVRDAIEKGVALLIKLQINGMAWEKDGMRKRLVAKADASPLWSRYHDSETLLPIFGDRDMRIFDDVNDISDERSRGYAWYGTSPARAIAEYEKWKQGNGK